MTVWQSLMYNPIVWIMVLLFFGIVCSECYWYCKTNFELKGSWKQLDKSIHWKKK